MLNNSLAKHPNLDSKNFNDILLLEDYLFRDNYRDVANYLIGFSESFNSEYEKNFLVNELLSDRKRLYRQIKLYLDFKSETGFQDYETGKQKSFNFGNISRKKFEKSQRNKFNIYSKKGK